MSPTRLPFRSQVLGLLACLPLVLPAVALAQSDADGGILIPDASVGEGGPDRDNEEGEGGVGRVNEVCRSSRDCSPRFTCQEGQCRYTGVRKAEQHGCVLGAEAALVLVGAAMVGTRRTKK